MHFAPPQKTVYLTAGTYQSISLMTRGILEQMISIIIHLMNLTGS